MPEPSSAARLAALKAEYPPAEGPADIEARIWNLYLEARADKERAEETVQYFEIKLREQAGTATRLKVNGTVVARRVVSRHEGAWVQDTYRRTGKDTDNA